MFCCFKNTARKRLDLGDEQSVGDFAQSINIPHSVTKNL